MLEGFMMPFGMAGYQPRMISPWGSRSLPQGNLAQASQAALPPYEFSLAQPRTFSRLLERHCHDQMSQHLRRHFEKYKVVNKSKVIVVLFIFPESTSGIYLCKPENI